MDVCCTYNLNLEPVLMPYDTFDELFRTDRESLRLFSRFVNIGSIAYSGESVGDLLRLLGDKTIFNGEMLDGLKSTRWRRAQVHLFRYKQYWIALIDNGLMELWVFVKVVDYGFEVLGTHPKLEGMPESKELASVMLIVGKQLGM